MSDAKLKVGDRIRLTGSEWDDPVNPKHSDFLPKRGSLGTVIRITERGLATFKPDDFPDSAWDSRLNTEPGGAVLHFVARWGCELAESEPTDDETLIQDMGTHLSTKIRIINNKTYVSIRTGNGTSTDYAWSYLEDEHLDELILRLQYVKMVRDERSNNG